MVEKNTNTENKTRSLNYQMDQNYLDETDRVELLAPFRLLCIVCMAHLSLNELWLPKFGVPIFRCIISKNGQEFLLNCLHVDSKQTREKRRIYDKFAPIRDIQDQFIHNSNIINNPSEFVLIVEQLQNFNSRCPFKIYIPSRPGPKMA